MIFDVSTRAIDLKLRAKFFNELIRKFLLPADQSEFPRIMCGSHEKTLTVYTIKLQDSEAASRNKTSIKYMEPVKAC